MLIIVFYTVLSQGSPFMSLWFGRNIYIYKKKKVRKKTLKNNELYKKTFFREHNMG